MQQFFDFTVHGFDQFMRYTAFANFTLGHLIMIIVALIFLYLAIAKDYEPLLLVPIGFGILIGNVPFLENAGLQIGIYEKGSVLNYLYFGVSQGVYPPLIFLGIGAMTDFSTLLSNPRLMLIGAAAQFGIFGAYIIATASPSRGNWNYWRCRWSNGYIFIIQISPRISWGYCGFGLFIHGISSRNSASNYEITYYR